MGWVLRVAVLVATIALACTSTSRSTARPSADDAAAEISPPNDPLIVAVRSDPLSCTERVALPQVEQLDNPFDARWADDSNTIAVSRIVTIPNPRMVTGSEEDQRISLLDLATGSVRDLGPGSKPSWSGGGIYLSYWREGSDDLRLMRGGRVVGGVPATQPDVRWVGDELYFFQKGEIRVWKDGVTWTVANVAEELVPTYPRDDVYFSADAQRFTMTRYFASGDVERYLGTTSTGAMERLGDGDTLFTQWGPVGHTLLLRSASAVSVLKEDGRVQSAPASSLPGPVHGWTGDGRVLFGRMSATLPSASAFDTFAVFGDTSAVAALPNLLGVRAFSPDGRFFMGVTRSGLYSTQLEVYRCGAPAVGAADPRADTVARARAASIDADPRRFVRPVSGAIAQYVQGVHTGIDVAAPFGAIVVASDDGVVTAVGWVPVGGRRVCVLHRTGIESCDYHTSLPLVAVGEPVVRGQPLALVGLTGMTFGPHTHWEAKLDGVVVDPLKQ